MSVLSDAAAVLTALAGFPVVKAHQKKAGAPRPIAGAGLYGTVQIPTSAPTSATPISRFQQGDPPATFGDKTLTQLRLGTLVLDVYGDGAQEAAQGLQLSIRRRSARLEAGAASNPLVITPFGDVASVPILRDTAWEEHAQVEFQIQWIQTDAEAMERIETVNVTQEIKDAEGNEIETLVITVQHTDTPP